MATLINLPAAQNVPDFRIEQLFGSKTRARLLSLFFENPERAFYVRELTRRIDAQLNSVRRELKNLVDLGMVLEVEGKILPTERESEEPVESKEGAKFEKKKYYQAQVSFPLFADLRNVMKKAAVLMNNRLVHDLGAKGKLELLLLTGRFAENQTVATDVLIIGDQEVGLVAEVIKAFETDIGREVNYTFMPKEEFLYRREVGDRFLASILEAKNIVLVNKLGSSV
jgi:hypothetical protein